VSKKRHLPRVARRIPGGLRLQPGANRAAWWRKRWILWLESFRMGARLGRGRSYAQSGQVRELAILPGVIEATVQGASPEPYSLRVSWEPLDAQSVQTLLDANPFLTAQLLARALPLSFEELLQTRGMSLFPREGEPGIRLHCTCKDWARPCKHLAAALCLFADAIAADPLLLLRFRGILFPETPMELQSKRLPADLIARLSPSARIATIPKRLGALPYWRGEQPFLDTLADAYRRAQDRALDALDAFPDLRFPEDRPASSAH